MADKPKVVVAGKVTADAEPLVDALESVADRCESSGDWPMEDSSQIDAGLFVGLAPGTLNTLQFCATGLLDRIPDGLVLADMQQKIIWHNKVFQEMSGAAGSVVGSSFYDVFESAEPMPPVSCPFQCALGETESVTSTLKLGNRVYLELHSRVIPPSDLTATAAHVCIAVRDVTRYVLQKQKLEAIYQAGIELGDVSPEEIRDMSDEDRAELLKDRILTFAHELLGFDVLEIRLVDPRSQELLPLVEIGMGEEAAKRELFVAETGNGVTGHVAATGQSYLCGDAGSDPLYLEGTSGGRSSLTVPLILHEQVLGTFNVESSGLNAFDETDREFLTVFGKVVALALNQLNLLAVEKAATAETRAHELLRDVSRPTDDILVDITWVLEKYIGHDPDVCDRLNRVLDATRTVRAKIHQASRCDATGAAYAHVPEQRFRPNPKLLGKHVLVADSDDIVRESAHTLLGRLGCEVETVPSGELAFQMARTHHYDVVLADIRLPDMDGYECFVEMRRIHEHMPVILMTGFGYDPTHSIVKARQNGLKAVLYKPFRPDQLISEVEKAVTTPPAVSP